MATVKRVTAVSDEGEVSQLREGMQQRLRTVERNHQQTKKLNVDTFNISQMMCVGLSGPASNLVLVLPGGTSEDVSAADLNTAAVGKLSRFVSVQFQDADGNVHSWFRGTPTVTPAESVADVDVVAPTVVGTPKFNRGRCLVKVTFDTDAGATKTYAAADSVTVQVQIPGDSLLGYSLAAGGVTKTFNVV